MEYTIDSIKNDIARMIDEEENIVELDTCLLPMEIQEGSTVEMVDGIYIIVGNSISEKRIQSKFNDVFDR